MNWNNGIRQTHRWMALFFTVTVIVTFIVLAQKEPVLWLSYLPLAPLALLQITGLYLFVQPHAAKWRSARRTAS
jgi:heme/copper-type cytochrome/quinol oxidase subunit 1